ncbi:hypothetical protein CWR48_04965 [Oceanobacillus arenosus]|uniref:Uncharacterized protein n=1 Tax=Oceanobacillus arenosus TaxID=1229153 RepID=A0A3D8PXS6_9BACI|nr:hypothetical protein [Oceanobacillus arenosus]RDW20078.1 hypothetical protein CWR48_04965 [Oceanobacillus arenosus]
MKKQFTTQILYSEDVSWLTEIYKKCLKLDFDLIDDISDWTGGIYATEEFSEGYEPLLQATVCELGGHVGHYQLLHQTAFVSQLVEGQISCAEFITEIRKIIIDDDTEGADTSTISCSEAVRKAKEDITIFKVSMSHNLTEIIGSKEPIPFYRCDDILLELDNYILRFLK